MAGVQTQIRAGVVASQTNIQACLQKRIPTHTPTPGFIQGHRQRVPHQDWKQQLAANPMVIVHRLLICT